MSLFLIPISNLQHTPLPSKCCESKSTAIRHSSIVFAMDSHLSLLKSLGVRHLLSLTLCCYYLLWCIIPCFALLFVMVHRFHLALLLFIMVCCLLPYYLLWCIIPCLVLLSFVVVRHPCHVLLLLFVMVHHPSPCDVITYYSALPLPYNVIVVGQCDSLFLALLFLHAFFKYSPHFPLCCWCYLLWFIVVHLVLLFACWGHVLPPLLPCASYGD